ncbi:MAG TPA: hypothetical protein VJN64_06575 [Terriglobales bacterium]|nr:hypothetical protein [Terriglobales bacterium]
MNKLKYTFITAALSIVFGFLIVAPTIDIRAQKEDPFEAQIGSIKLVNQPVTDGFAQLSQSSDISVSIEYPLTHSISDSAARLPRFTAELKPGKPAEILDQLCSLDPQFAWVRIGNAVNIFPAASRDKPDYLFNRVIRFAKLSNVSSADKAVIQLVNQLPGPRQQIATLQTTGFTFSEPLTHEFRDVTVRQALDEIAQILGPTYGWQLSGAEDFRVVMFHTRLRPGSPAKVGALSRR